MVRVLAFQLMELGLRDLPHGTQFFGLEHFLLVKDDLFLALFDHFGQFGFLFHHLTIGRGKPIAVISPRLDALIYVVNKDFGHSSNGSDVAVSSSLFLVISYPRLNRME